MIELTPDQTRALDAPPKPAVAVDPRTGQEYLLIRREIYDKIRLMLRPFGRNWDNPADADLVRKDAVAVPRGINDMENECYRPFADFDAEFRERNQIENDA